MYSRTQNENGTYNTRCLDCLMTVGFSIESEEELGRVESHHLCPEKVLHELMEHEQVPVGHGTGN